MVRADASAMADALARHDELVAKAVARNHGVLLKAKGEGDSTFSVFTRASDAGPPPWKPSRRSPPSTGPRRRRFPVRMALHTGEALERDGDYYGRTVNRVARLRSIAGAARSSSPSPAPRSSAIT